VPQGRRQNAARAVDWNVAQIPFREILRQSPQKGAEATEPPVGAQPDPVDTDFQHVARLGPGDRDGASENVAADRPGLAAKIAL
jgi:hypothetical protein